MEKKQLTPAQLEWFKKNLAIYSYREVARKLLNAIISKRTGLSLEDLPDSSILCDAIDEIEDLLKIGNLNALTNAYNDSLYYASEIIDTIME
jgi:hypothetical protein